MGATGMAGAADGSRSSVDLTKPIAFRGEKNTQLSAALILGSMVDKIPKAKEYLKQFGESEWRLILEHVDETFRSAGLQCLYPKSKESILQFGDLFPTARLANRVLGIFYLCGGEEILRSEKLQRQLNLQWLLRNNILLTAQKL